MSATAIISARMGSSRLPGKTLLTIQDRPVLAYQVERVRAASLVKEVVVATSVEPRDDPIAHFCARQEIPCFRGSEADVLDRIYQAAREHDADPVVRLTGDDPLADPAVIDLVLGVFFGGDFDYVSNVNPPTFPDGLDVEVLRFGALETIWRNAVEPEDREHVTRYLRRSLGEWKTANVAHDRDLSSRHWALDTREHFVFIERAIAALYPSNPCFGWEDVLTIEE